MFRRCLLFPSILLVLSPSAAPQETHDHGAPEKLGKLDFPIFAAESAGNPYWADQTRVMKREVAAWSAQAEKNADSAVSLLSQAADEEDSVEKLPVTPGPIVPAREQLGQLFLVQGHADLAAREFQKALASAPGRRGALQGASEAAEQMHRTIANQDQPSPVP